MKSIALSVGALVLVVVLVKLMPVTVAGQEPAAAAPSKSADTAKPAPEFKTPWGEPDLQGIWTDEDYSPLERPARYADREFLTDAERADIDAKWAKRKGYDHNLTGFGPYNEVYHLARRTGRRTSVIVDPPNGRMPPLTPEALKRRETFQEFRLADVRWDELPAELQRREERLVKIAAAKARLEARQARDFGR